MLKCDAICKKFRNIHYDTTYCLWMHTCEAKVLKHVSKRQSEIQGGVSAGKGGESFNGTLKI